MSSKLAEIKKELGEISDWPWSRQIDEAVDCINCKDTSKNALINKTDGTEHACDDYVDATFEDMNFIASAPQRISMLLGLVEEAVEMAEFYNAGQIDMGTKAQQFLQRVREELE